MTNRDDQPAAEQLDPAVVAALYVEHGEELRRFLQGLLRDAQLANDCLQATFVKLVEQGQKTREETRKAWLFRVAYHEAMAYRRREATGQRIIERTAWTTNGSASSADEPVARFESVQAVREALNELPFEQRQVVRMRIYEEKTFATISKELQIPLGTALARMRSALIKLQAILVKQKDS
jgi:RNA polymerase sigma factor (sigma-70 family)